MTKKYVYRSLAMLGQLYDESGEEANFPNGTKFYLASDIDGLAAEPPAEQRGMGIGCNGCGVTTVLTFTDASKQHVSVKNIEGWTAGPQGTFCPKCTAENRGVAHD